MARRNQSKRNSRTDQKKKQMKKVVRKATKKIANRTIPRPAVVLSLERQFLHPFDDVRIVRGPNCGSRTGTVRMYLRGTVTADASGVAAVFSTPYPYANAFTFTGSNVTFIAANLDAGAVAHPAAATIAAFYKDVRPLAAGLRVITPTALGSQTGTMYLGNVPTSFNIKGSTFTDFYGCPTISDQHISVPGEVLWNAQVKNVSNPFFTPGTANTAAGVLDNSYFAIPCAVCTGLATGQQILYESVWLVEGIPSSTAATVADTEVSFTTTNDWELARMAIPTILGARNVRHGVEGALEEKDGWDFMPSTSTIANVASVLPAMAAGASAISYMRRGGPRPRVGPGGV